MSAPAGTKRITVNGEARSLPAEGTTLTDLLRHLDIGTDASGVAVAVEGEVVRRQDWSETSLAGGENIEIITAQQGG